MIHREEIDTIIAQVTPWPMEERVALLMEDYDFFVKDCAYFCQRLDVLAEFRGKMVVQNWKEQVMSGNVEPEIGRAHV